MESIVFSNEDCEYIKSFWDDNQTISGKDYTVQHKGDETLVIKHDASGYCINNSNSSLVDFVIEKVKPFGITSISLGSIKVVRYREGDYFAPHRDYIEYDNGIVYKTAIIQLSDEEDYTGGTLKVRGVPKSNKQGSLTLFNSSELHEVTEVTRGERFSLVLFLFKEDLSFSKSLV